MNDFKFKPYFIPAGLFLSSFLIRFYVLFYSVNTSFRGDEVTYWHMANKMIAGKFSQNAFMPGWPFLLSFPVWIADSTFLARFFVVLLASISTVLIYTIGRNHFGKKLGLGAGIVHCFYLEQIFSSHYLYSEIGLEVIILSAILIIFNPTGGFGNISRVKWAALLLGTGLLYKHFVVIIAAPLVLLMLFQRTYSIKQAIVLITIFIFPLVIYSSALKIKGGDFFFFMNAPLKSMKEWHDNRIASGPKGMTKAEAVSKYMSKTVSNTWDYKSNRVKRNLRALWGFRSYPSDRIESSHYLGRVPRQLATIMKVFHAVLFFLGMAGLMASPKTQFKYFSILTLLMLTGLSFVLFMASRYRLPFMPILIVHAVYGIQYLISRYSSRFGFS